MFPLKDDNPLRSIPWVTLLLIATNVLVFLWQLAQGPATEYGILRFAMVPLALAESLGLAPDRVLVSRMELAFLQHYDPAVPAPLTIFTAMFMHGGWAHLLGNMWFLWIFGNNVEDEMGQGAFLAFYFLCGLAAALCQVAVDLGSATPMVGASGAIAGVLGAYLLRFPHARVLTIVPFVLAWVVWIPAGLWLTVWIVGQILNSLSRSALEAGVAWYAHIGGFAAGALLGPVFMGARHRPPSRARW